MIPIFSPEDADLAKIEWSFVSGYAYVYEPKKKSILAHRVVCERTHGRIPEFARRETCDHINRIRHDNRRENIRIVSIRLNVINSSRIDNAPKYAYKSKGLYFGRVSVFGAPDKIGPYATAEEARRAVFDILEKLGEPLPSYITGRTLEGGQGI